MQITFVETLLLSFLIVALGYAFMASWTTLLYKRKSWGQLSQVELKVKQGSATLENRLDLFFRTFFTSFFTYQVYLVTLFLAGLMYLLFTVAGG